MRPSPRPSTDKTRDQENSSGSHDQAELQWHQWTDALHQFWRQSWVRATFSPSLPQTEESEFEEKFKYMIVTSPFISSDTPSISLGKNKKNTSSPHMTTDYSTRATRASRAGKVGTAAVMTGLLASLGAEAIMVMQQQYDEHTHGDRDSSSFPFLMSATTLATASMASFFVYRHKRRSDIRQLYQTALINLRALMEQCEALDTKISRSILMIEEVESLRPGRTCTLLRSCVQTVLRRIFNRFEETIIDMADHVNKSNLSHLFDMYNIRYLESLSSMDHFDETKVQDRLRSLWQLVHVKRRECMVQFLALNIVSQARDSEQMGYVDSWATINRIIASLADEIRSYVADIMDALETELYAPVMEDAIRETQAPLTADRALKPFVDSLEILDQHIRNLEAKFHVCRDDVRELSSPGIDKGKAIEMRNRLKHEYQSIEAILSGLLSKWQQGQQVLLIALEPPETSSTTSMSPAMSRRYRTNSPNALDLTASALPLPPSDKTPKNEDILPPSPASLGEPNSSERKRCKT
ncbi:Mysoin-binding motif of peroxisomes-domain-containing protein [Dichotomocladium elegans]|nr:Mysoin-binding motif of peroxisomes-domain-containing protein [Dichotomocladium elegans]